jgi:hypothetical protein
MEKVNKTKINEQRKSTKQGKGPFGEIEQNQQLYPFQILLW